MEVGLTSFHNPSDTRQASDVTWITTKGLASKQQEECRHWRLQKDRSIGKNKCKVSARAVYAIFIDVPTTVRMHLIACG
jgi:hypothetical protein